jgi:light-regulated signal transduction histidine kinase (bacteriophytochrome)
MMHKGQRIPSTALITFDAGPGGARQVCVTDNGIGAAPGLAEKVFVIFRRLHGGPAASSRHYCFFP